MTLRVSSDLIVEAMQSDPVRAALRERAEQVASRAVALGASEDVDMEVRVIEGTRPKGRPFARVESPNVEQEWGSGNTARRRILGRAGGASLPHTEEA